PGALANLVVHLNPMEAELLRSRLEAEGVYAVTADADTVRAGWLYAGASGARVLVAERDMALAKDVLAKLQAGEFQIGDRDPPPRCPNCDGTELKAVFPGVFASLFKYGGNPSRRLRCESCGRTWPNSTSSI